MDEDDQMAAEAHQQELEARQREEESIARHRRLMEQFRIECAEFDRATESFHNRVDKSCLKW